MEKIFSIRRFAEVLRPYLSSEVGWSKKSGVVVIGRFSLFGLGMG